MTEQTPNRRDEDPAEREIRIAWESILTAENINRPKITEYEFTQHLLPLLYDRTTGENDLSVWMNIAGHAHRSIDVTGHDGSVIFTVPPILARTPTIAARPDRDPDEPSVNEIAYNYGAMLGTVHEGQAVAYLDHALRKHIVDSGTDDIAGHLREWVRIYTRYKLPLSNLFGFEVENPNEGKADADKKADAAVDTTVNAELSGDFDDL